MANDFYPFVDSGAPVPDNSHITGDAAREEPAPATPDAARAAFATRIAIYDDMLSTPRVVVIEPAEVRPYLEEVTNTVYRCMKEQGGTISLMVIREIVENFIHAHFMEPIISILDGGQTIRFADQGPGIADKERAFEFGVTSANRGMKQFIRGTGAGFPMVQQYLEAAGGAVSIEDNLGAGTVVTVSLDPTRVEEIKRNTARGAAVRGAAFTSSQLHAKESSSAAENTPFGTPWQAAPNGANGTQAGAWSGSPTGATPSGMPGPATGAMPAGVAAPYNPYQAYPYGYPQSGYPASPVAPGGWAGPSGIYGAAPAAQPYPAADNAAVQPSMPAQPFGAGAYQQYGHNFSTSQQLAGEQPFGTPAAMPSAPATPAVENLYVSDRGRLALAFLAEHGQAGPTELALAFGNSGPTWSRELATLGECGFVIKHGQKYHLTALGSSWMQTHGGGA